MKIICGRAGTGKSYFCMQEIKEAILKDAGRTYIYVVPEQYSLSAEFELANMANQNGTINIQVLSFKRLAYRVFNELGIAKPTFSNASKNMLIYYIMLKENKNLKILKGVDKNRGLANTVANMISEFKRYNVTVDTLKNANIKDEYLKNKIDDLALIYEKFEEKISKDYIETDSNLTVLAKLIDRSNMLDNAKIWIDGFDGFTPQELCIISALNKKADVTVTLCQDSGELFAINQKVLDKLRMFGDVNEVKFENQYRLKNAELMHLEKSMFKYPLKKFNDDVKNIHISLEASPYDEVESVAKIITKKVRTENLRFENIGIITKNIDTYKTAFNKVFSLYDIPYFFDDKKELANQPLLTMVLSLFDILSKGFRYEDVFNYLKSGFSNIDDVNDVDILENYVLANGIRGNRWFKEFDYKDKYSNFDLEKINLIREKFVAPILEFKEGLEGKKTAQAILESLYKFLIDIGIYKKLEAISDKIKFKEDITSRELEIFNTYIKVWNVFMELLDELFETCKDEQMSFDTFKNILIQGIAMHQIGLIPTSRDHVLIGDTSRTKNSNIKVLFVIGVNDGVFPMPFNTEGFLTDSDREYLLEQNIELAKTTKLLLQEENFNIYRALTTASDEIYISYPTSDSDGNVLRPSSIINQIKTIFINLKVESHVIDNKEIVSNPKSTFKPTLNNARMYLDGKAVDDTWKNAYVWYMQNDKERIIKALNGFDYKNTIEYLDRKSTDNLYGDEMYTSVSRLEKYAKCPYSYFLRYGLNLKERKEFKLETPDIGTFLHEILDRFAKYILENNISIKEISQEMAENIIEELVTATLSDPSFRVLSSTNAMKTLTKRLIRVAKRMVGIVIMHLKAGSFKIAGSEVEFGKDKEVTAVELALSDGKKLVLNGKIDRVDIAQTADGKYLRIIDYKSYDKEIELSDIYYGLELQLLVYLDAVQKDDLIPGGALYLKLDDPIISAKNNYKITKEKIEEEIIKKLRMKGIILADAKLLDATDVNWELKSKVIEVKKDKSGATVNNTSSPKVSLEELNKLKEHMRKVLREIGDKIYSGNIDIAPIKKDKNSSSCDFCEYKLICRFDKELGNKYNKIKVLNDKEVLEKIME